MLPADFPDWRTCYKYFRQWSERPGPQEESILEQVLKKSVGAARRSNGRKERTSFCIVDSQSVKNTDSAGNKGYDAGKKVSQAHKGDTCPVQGPLWRERELGRNSAAASGTEGAMLLTSDPSADIVKR